VIIAGVVVLFKRLPSSFLPDEDQGYMITVVQLPTGATQERTIGVLKQIEDYYLQKESKVVDQMITVAGFSFFGRGQNGGIAFVRLKDWKERPGADQTAQALVGRAFGALSFIKDAIIFPLNPPAISELGNSSGFDFRLQDRSGQGHAKLMEARNQMLGMAAQSPVLQGVRPEGQEDAPQLRIDIDREKARAGRIGGRYQLDAVDRVWLLVRERLHLRGPRAPCDRAGRRCGSPPAGRSDQAARAQCQWRHGGVCRVRDVEVDHGFAAPGALQRHAGREARWPGRAGQVHWRGHARDGGKLRQAAAGLRFRVVGPVV
jgi:hypothetical protein